MNAPLVSVVTPFHNTAAYLAECIESVLRQDYPHFEYILVDNCSTDRSSEIAQAYARRDNRIRFFRRPKLLSQVENYNQALAEISDASVYSKIVQADDHIFPECVRLMVEAFEQSESIGLVSSYDLKGGLVRGSGFPYPLRKLPGKEVARLFLQAGLYVFGSPTTVMYRSSLIRDCRPFFDESLLHEDTEKCMQIMEHWDFGFVHQILSFVRTDNDSISSKVRHFQDEAIDSYIITQRYAPVFLEPDDARAARMKSKSTYYEILACEALRFRQAAFWRYHERGLRTLGQKLDRIYLLRKICRILLRRLAHPTHALTGLLGYFKPSSQTRL